MNSSRSVSILHSMIPIQNSETVDRVPCRVNSTLEVVMETTAFVTRLLQLWQTISGERAIRAFERFCDTGNSIRYWYETHPDLDIACWKHSRGLVSDHIQAYLDLLELHPFIERDGRYLNFLFSLSKSTTGLPPASTP